MIASGGAIPRKSAHQMHIPQSIVAASKPPTSRGATSSYSSSNDEQGQKTTKKHADFLRNGTGNQPVTTLPGIGPVYGSRLAADGCCTVCTRLIFFNFKFV